MLANQAGTTVGRMVLLSCPVHWPKYSPDFNPIEQVFAKIKHLMRRAMERTVQAVQERLASFLDTIPPNECANYFNGAGYTAT